jgi:hypothetical protein
MNESFQKTTKFAQVKTHLIEKGFIDSWTAISLYGATRLSSIIFILRKKGMNIITEPLQSLDRNKELSRFAKYVVQPIMYDYTLINFCCYEESRLGSSKFHKGACRTIMITEELDGSTHKALELCRMICNHSGSRIAIWGSLPCTGGCTWNYINGRTPEGRAKIEEHVKIMVSLLRNFVCVCV